MLVLSRRLNESIMVGDDVEIRIVDIKGEHVKLGITAPRSIPVHRKEIYEAIKKENIRAAQNNVQDLNDLNKLLDREKPPKEPPSGPPKKSS